MVPNGGTLIQKDCLAGVSCIYDISRRIAVNVAADFVKMLEGLAG